MDQRNLESGQSNEASGQHQPSANGQTPQIFKLNVDCFEKVFDYLSLDDLHSFRQTCTRMQRVADYYFKLEWSDHFFSHDSLQRFDGFREYIEDMIVCDQGVVDWNQLNSLKKVDFGFWRSELPKLIKDIPKEIANKIEQLGFENLGFNMTCQSNLERFPNLKRININSRDLVNSEMTPKYPKVEHVKFLGLDNFNIETFLKQNPTVRSIDIDAWALCKIGTSLSEARLDDMYVNLVQGHLNEFPVELFRDVTQFLFDKGTCKRIHLTFESQMWILISKYSKLKPAFTFSTFHAKAIDVSPLVQLGSTPFLDCLTEPHLSDNHDCFANLIKNPAIAKGLENLKKIYFYKAHIDKILPFIRLSPQLEKVMVENKILSDSIAENVLIDPIALNRERQKLSKQLANKGINVQKVEFFIPASNYLATRWKTVDTDLEFIKIRRCPGVIDADSHSIK